MGETLRSRGRESMATSPVSWSRLITLVILAKMLFPQRTNQTTAPIISRIIMEIIQRMILRFLDIGFFTFLSFLDFLDFLDLAGGMVSSGSVTSSIDVVEAVSSPLVLSKSKTWVGLRKSVAEGAVGLDEAGFTVASVAAAWLDLLGLRA